MKLKIFIMMILSFAVCQAMPERHETLKTELSEEWVESLKSATEFRVYKVTPMFHDQYEMDSKSFLLNEVETREIKEILLNDKSYIFNFDRPCLFLPEYALKIDDNEKLLMLINISGKQLSIPHLFSNRKIIIDPSIEKILKIIIKYVR